VFRIDKRYLKVIDHKNYNPRLIEFITDSDKLDCMPTPDYWTSIESNLSNPTEVWAHPFDNQLDDYSRDLVVLVALNGKPIPEKDLESAFQRLHQVDESVHHHVPSFRTASGIVVGAMLNRVLDQHTCEAKYDVFNPSIADFVIARMAGALLELARYIDALRSPTVVFRLAEFAKAQLLNESAVVSVAENLMSTVQGRHTWEVDAYLLSVTSYAVGLQAASLSVTKSAIDVFEKVEPTRLRSSDMEMACSLAAWICGLNHSASVVQKAEMIARHALSLPLSEDCLMAAQRLCRALPSSSRREELLTLLRGEVVGYWIEEAPEHAVREQLLAHLVDDDAEDQGYEIVEKSIREQLASFELEFSDDEVLEIVKSVDVSGQIETNRQRLEREYDDNDRWDDDVRSSAFEENMEIELLFGIE
jgi:hypothetical protein